MNTDHGLKTDRPVQRNARGELMVQQENGGWRAPTAVERGIPTKAEVKGLIQPELDELTTTLGVDKTELQRAVQDTLNTVGMFHKTFDTNNGVWKPARGGENSEVMNKFFRMQGALSKVQGYGTQGTMIGSTNPRVVALADRIFAKLAPIVQKVAGLEQPAT